MKNILNFFVAMLISAGVVVAAQEEEATEATSVVSVAQLEDVAETEEPVVDYQWTETFSTKVGSVVHTPDRVSMGFISCGETLNFNCKVFNGVTMAGPLVLHVKSSREDFITAMRSSGIYD